MTQKILIFFSYINTYNRDNRSSLGSEFLAKMCLLNFVKIKEPEERGLPIGSPPRNKFFNNASSITKVIPSKMHCKSVVVHYASCKQDFIFGIFIFIHLKGQLQIQTNSLLFWNIINPAVLTISVKFISAFLELSPECMILVWFLVASRLIVTSRGNQYMRNIIHLVLEV